MKVVIVEYINKYGKTTTVHRVELYVNDKIRVWEYNYRFAGRVENTIIATLKATNTEYFVESKPFYERRG